MLFLNADLALPGVSQPIIGSLRCLNGKITEIGPNLEPLPDEEIVNATGLLLLPGAIDSNVHFGTPGCDSQEDWLHGTAEAARGGTTTVIDMPYSSQLPVIDAAGLEAKLAAITTQSVVDYGLFAGLCGAADPLDDKLAQRMAEMVDKVLGFKATLFSDQENFPRLSHAELEQALKIVHDLKRPLLLQAEDADYIRWTTARIKAQRGNTEATWEDYADSRPEIAELVASTVALALAGNRAGSLHVVNIASADAAEALWLGGASSETCCHYLAFSREDFSVNGMALKTAPPVKSPIQADRLWAQLAEGRIAFVTSDHRSTNRAAKPAESVWTAFSGIPGVGIRLSYLFSEGYLAGRLNLERFLDLIAAAAAKRFGLFSRKGSLEVGKDADLVLMDRRPDSQIRADRFYCKGRDTPFEGLKLKGAVRSTWIRGKLVYDALEDAAGRSADVFMGSGRRAQSSSPLAAVLHSFAPGIMVEPGFGKLQLWGS